MDATDAGLTHEEFLAVSGLAPIPVIAFDAKAIVPIRYEQAIVAIAQCCTLDEAKTWTTKAEALAAWAKIYRDDAVSIEARRLKLHAWRRMGILAGEIRPMGSSIGRRGPLSLLQETGFSKSASTQMRYLGNMAAEKFDAIVKSDRQVSPSRLINVELSANPAWKDMQQRLSTLRAILRRNDPSELGHSLSEREATTARQTISEIYRWIEKFDSALPQVNQAKVA